MTDVRKLKEGGLTGNNVAAADGVLIAVRTNLLLANTRICADHYDAHQELPPTPMTLSGEQRRPMGKLRLERLIPRSPSNNLVDASRAPAVVIDWQHAGDPVLHLRSFVRCYVDTDNATLDVLPRSWGSA